MLDESIKINDLKIICNFNFSQVLYASIREAFGVHGMAHIVVQIDIPNEKIIETELHSQPIEIYAVKKEKDILLFRGVIFEVGIAKEGDYATMELRAYTLTWMMDLEKKCRSFQDTNQTILSLITSIQEEYSYTPIFNVKDKYRNKPFIQYHETDWEFLLRLSSHLHSPVIPMSDDHNGGFCIGFPEKKEVRRVYSSSEKWCMDTGHAKYENWRNADAAYYKVTTDQIFHLGEKVLYRDTVMWVHKVHLFLERGILQCLYDLASQTYRPVLTSYNKQLKGVSLSGTVLERKEEQIKIHLDIDGEQDTDKACWYSWLPEFGNILYCMPEKGSKVRLQIPNGDEQKAFASQCVRQNGTSCDETQNPNNRWFVTKEDKKMTLQPQIFEISAPADQSKILLEDSSGSIFSTSKDLLLQAEGDLILMGTNVTMSAPKEITAVRRQLGEPAVVNICHNLDTMGGKSYFKNLPGTKGRMPKAEEKQDSREMKVDSSKTEQMKQKQEKMLFQMKELTEKQEKTTKFKLGPSVTKIMAAIPQSKEHDPLAQIAVGSRPMFGKMKVE